MNWQTLTLINRELQGLEDIELEPDHWPTWSAANGFESVKGAQ